MRAKVREGYSFIRTKGNLHVKAGTIMEDLTMEEAEGQAWKLDFLKDGTEPVEVQAVEVVEEKEVEVVEEKEVEEVEKEEVKEEAETKDIEAPPADRAIKRKKRK